MTKKCTEILRRGDQAISKPDMVIQYKTYMDGVDKCDQFLSYQSLGCKPLKWCKLKCKNRDEDLQTMTLDSKESTSV